MARRYTIQANYSSITTAHDILRMTAKAGGVMRLIELHVTNDADETSEMLPFSIQRGSTDGTGTAVSPHNTDPSDTSSSSSCAYNLSAVVTKTDPVHRESANILSGFHYVPTPEARPIAANGARLVCRLETAPTNALAFSVNAVIEEEG